MSKRQHTLLLGYARRMAEIAKLASEMKDIADKYEREFGAKINDGDLSQVLTGERLARLHASLVADRPEPAPEAADDVLEPVPVAPGAALGLVPAPAVLLNDGFGDELTTAEKRGQSGV